MEDFMPITGFAQRHNRRFDFCSDKPGKSTISFDFLPSLFNKTR
jgi:hypothetical protein